MSLSLTRLMALVRKELGGLDSTDISDDEVTELLNMSLWDLEDKFPFKTREALDTSLTLVEGQASYSLAGITRLDSITSISIRLSSDDDYESHKLARMTRDDYDANFSGGEDSYGLPTRYLRESNTLYINPAPSSDYVGLALRIAHRQGVASLAAGSVTSTGLPRNWDEIVLHGATWRGHKIYGGDYNLAQQAANFQIGLIRAAVPVEAKEERDSRYARLNVIHDWPEGELEGHEGGY